MHTTHDNDIDALISRFADGSIDSPSLARLKAWAMLSDGNREYVRRQLEMALAIGVAADTTPFDAAQAYRRFLAGVGVPGDAAYDAGASATPSPRRLPVRVWRRVAIVAAVVAAVVLLPMVGFMHGRQTVKEAFADIVVDVPVGARMSMTLPDSTHVWLNSGSRLVYSQGFGMDNRQLRLSGEAFFDVAHDPSKPFTVHTREMDVRVVGTRFNMRNYATDDEVSVSLLSGCVALANNLRPTDGEICMRPMQNAVLDKRTGHVTLRQLRTAANAAWTGNELFFDESLLSDIAKKIERSYGVSVTVADSVRNLRFYGSFKLVGGSPDDILRAIAATGDVRCRTIGRQHYVLY